MVSQLPGANLGESSVEVMLSGRMLDNVSGYKDSVAKIRPVKDENVFEEGIRRWGRGSVPAKAPLTAYSAGKCSLQAYRIGTPRFQCKMRFREGPAERCHPAS